LRWIPVDCGFQADRTGHLLVEEPVEICSTDGVVRWHTATTKKGVDGPPQLTRIGTLSVDFVVPEFFTLLATEREVGATLRCPGSLYSF